jgi:putative peptidoglycan lipid II flippase
VLAAVTLLGLIFAPQLVGLFTLAHPDPSEWAHAVLLTRITLPFCLLVSVTALAGAVLNTFRVFGLPAAVPILLNLAIIASALTSWLLGYSDPALALALGVVVGGILQFLAQVPALLRRGFSFRFALGFGDPGVRRVAALMLPAAAGVGIYQINVLITTAFASAQEGWISALYYADRIMEVALGAYAISVATVVLPVMSQQAVENRLADMCKTLTFALRNVAFIVIPAAVGLIVLRDPIVRVLFQHRAFGADSTGLTAYALLFYALGLPAFAAVRLVVQAFYARKDTATPVRVSALALGVNLGLCFLLVGPLGHGGLALATSAASYVNLIVLYVLHRRRLGAADESRLALSLLRTSAAAAVMAVACWLLHREFLVEASNFGLLLAAFVATIALGVGVFLATAWLLRAEELGEFYTLLTGRRRAFNRFAGVGVVPGASPHK